jgi:probable F420-dependent oxidoreductase
MRDLDLGTGVLVALHGHGDDPASARVWGRQLAPAGWEIVAPGAPTDDEGVRSWFGAGPRGADAAALAAAVDRVRHVAMGVRSSGRPVVVAGFSQGGAVALEVAARCADVDGVVSICGFMADSDEADEARTYPLHVPVLVIGGTQDDHVPSFMSSDAAAVFGGHGRPTELHLVDSGHQVGAEAATTVRDWLVRTMGRGPRVSLGLPVDRVDSGPELVSGGALADLSRAYERFGFHAAYVTDHPAPDDRWLAGGGHQALEPTVALAVAAASTRHLLLHTNVYVLGYRNPFLAAKALASLDVVSDGRLVIGVAAGYLRAEFEALGADFTDRGRRLDETLELLPRIWSEHSVAAEGDGYRAGAVTALPHPVQRPHPPIWVGGNSLAAMRRAVRFGQGWSPFPTPPGVARATRTAELADLDGLGRRMARLDELCAEAGRREPLTTCFVPFSLAGYLSDPVGGLGRLGEEVAQLAGMGVDWVSLMVPGTVRNEVIDHAGALAEALGLG